MRRTIESERNTVGPYDAHQGEVRSVPQRDRLDGLVSCQSQPWKQWLAILALVSSDVLLATLVWYAAFVLQGTLGRGELSDATAAASVGVWVGVWVGLRALAGLYPGYGLDSVEELRRQTYVAVATMGTFAIFALAAQVGDLLSRFVLLAGSLGLFLAAPFLRHLVKFGMMRFGLWGKPVVILGAGKTGAHIIRVLQREWTLGFTPVAVFDNRMAPVRGTIGDVPYGGSLKEAIIASHKNVADTAIVALHNSGRRPLLRMLYKVNLNYRHVIVLPNLPVLAPSQGPVRNLGGTAGMEVTHDLLAPWARRTKRALDLFGALVGGAIISPLLLALAILIKLNSPGPVIFRQLRPGVEGKYFWMWKFRTMRVDADQLLTELLTSNPGLREEWTTEHKLRHDPRITRIGHLLRKMSLDELPQLWNVLRGEMSLVGPRPMLIEEIPKYGEVYNLYKRTKPGITGPWQVSGRNDIAHEERVEMVSSYVRNWSVWLDLILLTRTLRALISKKGAY